MQIKVKLLLSASAIFLCFNMHSAVATTYYSATNGGNWNVAATWSTVTYGNATNTGTYPVTGDVVYIGDGYTINITTSSGASHITIGQGTSGIIQYSGAGTFTLTVSGNLTINTGAKIWYNSNNSRTQNLFISGNIINNGTLDFYYDSNDRVNITFNSNANSIVSGTGAWALNDVTLTKSTSTANYLEIQSNGFESAIATLTVTYGTFIHNNSGSYAINSSGGAFTIDANAIFKVQQGTVNFSPSSNYLYLYGALYVSGGSVNIGSSSGNNGIRYNKTGTPKPYLEISGGDVNVYGGISYESGAGSDPFGYKMTGGTLTVNSGSSGTSVEAFLINDVSGSSFYMSDGTLIVQSPNTGGGSNYTDFGICGTNGTNTVTGGVVQFGNSNTGNNKTFNFTPFSGTVQPHIKVTGLVGNSITLCPAKSSTTDFKFLSLSIDSGKVFDVRSILGVNGDSKTMTLTSTYDNTNALINNGTFTARTGTVTFNTSGSQALAGNSTTTFYNLIINNSSNITLNCSVNVSNLLTLSTGKLISSAANMITCLSSGSANLGTETSYIDGPFEQVVATTSAVVFNLPIGTGSNYHPLVLTVQHTTNTAVTYSAKMINTPATDLGYGLPFSLSKVSDIRYYSINRQAIANLSSANLKIYYYADDGVTDFTNLRIAQDDGTSNWVNLSGTGTANTIGTITSTVFSTFNNWFTLANAVGGVNPLPLSGITFAGEKENDYIKLSWNCLSENNLSSYTIERSYTGITYDAIANIQVEEYNKPNKSYIFKDVPIYSGIIYYRLIVKDRQQNFSVFGPIKINQIIRKDAIAYPVPTDGTNLHLKLSDLPAGNLLMEAFDLNGKTIAMDYHYDPLQQLYIINFHLKQQTFGNACFLNIITGEELIRKKILLKTN